jgi:hypothetical protein
MRATLRAHGWDAMRSGWGRFGCLFAAALCGCASQGGLLPGATESGAPLARSAECVPAWQRHALPGKRATRYDPVEHEGRAAILARADASASMLRHPLRIEPTQLGSLSFAWRVQTQPAGADVAQRDVEDAPARIVLAFDGDHADLSAKDQMLFDLAQLLSGERPPYATLMYVWDAHAPRDSVVLGPRTERVRKIVVETGAEHLQQWRQYRRDIAADYRRVFGSAPGPLIGVGLMTDADNTGARAVAWYGPVCFAAAGAPSRDE